MRRHMIVIFAILMALGAEPASARYFLSPRGIFGLMTAPLRGMLGRFHGRYHHHHEVRHPAAAKAAEPKGTKVGDNTGQPESNAPQDASRLNAYDNVLGYAFWPNDYASEFNRFGYDDIAAAIAGPPPARPATNGSAAGAAPGASPSVCENADASTGAWLTGRVQQKLKPDAAQRHRLDALRGRISEGAKTIQASCKAPHPASPTARLAALRQRLWAVHDAGLLARHSLQAFYATLSAKQKAKFNSVADASRSGNGGATAQRYRECAAQGASATAHLLDRIQGTVKPTRAQQAKFEDLRKTAGQMEKLLLASCAQPIAPDPLARLDAAEERLVAMNFAAANMEVALNDLYASLDARQKAQFEALGR